LKLRSIIVDDEPLARSRLKRQLLALDIDVIAEGSNGRDAIDLVLNNEVELLFIDIQMPVMDGLQAVKELEQKLSALPTIIYCTAHDEYALKAFSTSAAAYLLKPAHSADIEAAIKKAAIVTKLQVDEFKAQSTAEKMLTIHYRGAVQKTAISEFTYFHSVDKSVFAKLVTGEQILVDHTLKGLQEQFGDELIRIHRSMLVNKAHVFRLVKDDSACVYIELSSGGSALKVSRRHVTEVKKCFD
jgi:two-component system response regulator AlgR